MLQFSMCTYVYINYGIENGIHKISEKKKCHQEIGEKANCDHHIVHTWRHLFLMLVSNGNSSSNSSDQLTVDHS